MSDRCLTSVAKVGRDRWLWCVWKSIDALIEKVDPAYGYEVTKEAAIARIFQVAGSESHYGTREALEWRSVLAARRRKPNLEASEAKTVEYVYHEHSWICTHRIFKKTKKRIFVNEVCWYRESPYGRPRALSLDRAKLEAGESVFVNHGPFRGAMCGEFFTLQKPSTSDYREVPECLAALGLKAPCTVEDVKRAFRKLSRERHPDAGGTGDAFMQLRRHYEEALSLAQ